MNNLDFYIVQNNVQYITFFKDAVKNIVQARADAGFSQEYMAKWIEVDRRKIAAIENGKLFDFELLIKYAEKLSIDFNIQLNIN
jgi:DNA-binding XRE family transcriptional regulator